MLKCLSGVSRSASPYSPRCFSTLFDVRSKMRKFVICHASLKTGLMDQYIPPCMICLHWTRVERSHLCWKSLCTTVAMRWLPFLISNAKKNKESNTSDIRWKSLAARIDSVYKKFFNQFFVALYQCCVFRLVVRTATRCWPWSPSMSCWGPNGRSLVPSPFTSTWFPTSSLWSSSLWWLITTQHKERWVRNSPRHWHF